MTRARGARRALGPRTWTPHSTRSAQSERSLASDRHHAGSIDARLAHATDLHQAGRFDEAVRGYEAVLECQPGHPEALHRMGLIAHQLGDFSAAVSLIEAAISIDHTDAPRHSNLGLALSALGHDARAVDCHDRAIVIDPSFAAAWYNRGLAWCALSLAGNRRQAQLQALLSFDRTLALDPGHRRARYQQGLARLFLGQQDEAVESFDRVLASDPEHAGASWNKSTCLLARGDLEAGWSLYGARWMAGASASVPLTERRPPWRFEASSSASPGRQLIWAEQGVGDHIFFGTLLPEWQARVPSLLVQCDRRLLPLFRRSQPDIAWRASDTPIDPGEYDTHLPLADLARLLRPSWSDFPERPRPWLMPDPQRVQSIRAALRGSGGPLIGIAWRSTCPRTGQARSIELARLAATLGDAIAASGGRLVSLQYGASEAELAAARRVTGVEVLACESVDPYADLDGLAALIGACDQIVSIDNSTVHLAGALGARVAVLLPQVADWRWFTDRSDSPWYAQVTLHRQLVDGEWAPVLHAVAQALVDGPNIRSDE